jgi:hypothetical protein
MDDLESRMLITGDAAAGNGEALAAEAHGA